ncbi:MAG: glycosyltransferase [Intrasporangium sp.]|uniref:glycosyltransferase n=1 Tax=Intrasporangium sp. TaxID=1925024 RepID=UPI003F803D6A
MSNHIDGLGGAERVSHAIADGLTRRGYDVTLNGIRPAADERVDLTDLAYPTGFMSQRPENSRNESPLPDHVRDKMREEAVANLERTLRRYRDGVFICTQLFVMEHVADIGIERQLNAGTRIIGQYHSSYDAAILTHDYKRISRLYRQIDKFLLLTAEDARNFRRKNFNNTGYVLNPLSTPRLGEGHAPEWEKENVVVAVARQDTNKQMDHLLRAWSTIRKDHPGWRLELHGDGPEHRTLLDMVKDLGIEQSVSVPGMTRDVPAVLDRAKISVLCSRFEGLPMVLAESQAHGVVPVAYDCSPGVRELIDHDETGLLVTPQDERELAASLSALMTDESRRREMSTRARRSVRRLDEQLIIDEWEDHIQRVMR